MNNEQKRAVGNRIKAIRLKNGLTQEEFGKFFSASKGNVATWEKGSSLPNAERLKMIATFDKISVANLLHGDPLSYFTNLMEFFPEDKKYLIGQVPVFAIKNAWEKISKEEISLDDKERLINIVKELIVETELSFKETTLAYLEVFKNNISEIENVWNKLDKESFILNSGIKIDEFKNLLQNPDLKKAAAYAALIESLYEEFLLSNNKDFFLSDIQTYSISFDEMEKSGYSTYSKKKANMNAIIKYSGQTNIYGHDYALAIYDSKSDKVFIVSQYNKGYKDFDYQKAHFVAYNKQVFVADLQDNDCFAILDSDIHINLVDFFAPLLSILF